jgi:uncharacterized protein (DUF433 family)
MVTPEGGDQAITARAAFRLRRVRVAGLGAVRGRLRYRPGGARVQYRDAGVPLIRMRPAIDLLREQLQTRYPLASARTWLDVDGRELVWKVQNQVGLERPLALVVVRTGQAVLDWSPPAEAFRRSVEWTTDGNGVQPRLVHPDVDLDQVEIDPLRGFGEPVVRNVRTEIIVELFRAGDSPEGDLGDLRTRTRSRVAGASLRVPPCQRRDRRSHRRLISARAVTADRDHLRFYVDESALGLGKALEAARRDTVHAVLDTS